MMLQLNKKLTKIQEQQYSVYIALMRCKNVRRDIGV